MDTWDQFKQAALHGAEQTVPPVALIVDSPWLPGYAGIDTRDYFLDQERWLEINRGLLSRFPGVTWVPGFWWEYGMAAEPSGFGVRLQFHPDQPPSVEPVVRNLDFWADLKPADPRKDGLMPLVLRQYQRMDARLAAEGLPIRMVCCRGPVTVASWLMGVTDWLAGFAEAPETVTRILTVVTTTLIDWLNAQLESLSQPEGILVLDDVVGMVSRKQYEALIQPHLQRIFAAFDGLVRVYHNDTPCKHLYPSLAQAGFDVFNFSHKTELAEARRLMGERVTLMGNVAPLDLGVRGAPEQVYQAALDCMRGVDGRGMILSFGGGVSPETPAENIDALIRAAQHWAQTHS